ncbi:hypothetical protein O6H91_23G010400 [Diphasiastrum complanatum]|uniref:Uncharacterized protein n=1 Tax=Diphasiastrum complanatum TaxID=34168 RepID=A0ACC2A811_DIPCM|nr:hypothetical protein O6H91_23G010400 [Diphasiastrum complanatum]
MDKEANVPVPFERTLFLVNVFIIHTVRLLNKFSAICEQKLADVHQRIVRLEATLSLLEAKLMSVDGLEKAGNVLDSTTRPAVHHFTTDREPEKLAVVHTDALSCSSLSSSSATNSHYEESMAVGSSRSEQLPKVKDDPRYSRFFKMLHVGVPDVAVKLQMSLEGIDSSLLDNPDAAATIH